MSSRIRKVLYLAAHGGFAGQAVPLGGGAAVANMLTEAWAASAPFDVRLVGPSILDGNAPSARDIVNFNERAYARFCHAFRDAATNEVLKHDPRETAVLVNDISEGPDFERLARAGFRIVTIYHVDVVAYIAAIYLRGRVRPATLARWWERLRGPLAPVLPAILRLIFDQQRASVEFSRKIVVPSRGMLDVLLETYDGIPRERVEVLPWGARESVDARAEAERLRRSYGIPENARVLLCLSRISPEKGQDLLLDALRRVRNPGPLWLFICGEPAFMQGAAYFQRLRTMAASLSNVRVVFPGYVEGLTKAAYFELADLYVFPSKHESYGLTLVEALAAGKPALALDHHGAREILDAPYGRIVKSVEEMARSLDDLLDDPARLRRMGDAARAWATAHPFGESVRRLESILLSC